MPEKKAFDEAFDKKGTARQHYRPLVSILESFTQGEIERRERLQKLSLMDQGITFTVYGQKEGTDLRTAALMEGISRVAEGYRVRGLYP